MQFRLEGLAVVLSALLPGLQFLLEVLVFVLSALRGSFPTPQAPRTSSTMYAEALAPHSWISKIGEASATFKARYRKFVAYSMSDVL
jgi:hypothetical protein